MAENSKNFFSGETFRTNLLRIFLIVALVLGAAYTYFVTFSPDRDKYTVRGIDVSHHQGEIDWPAVANDDVSFAYLKASEGGDFVDSAFKRNLEGALASDLPVGAYHFFTLCRPGEDQAANFLQQVPTNVSLLPPALDLEFFGNCNRRPSPEAVAREVEKFLTIIEDAFGREAIYYITGGFKRKYGAHLPKRSLWLRRIAMKPPSDNWLLWQYHDRGRIAGINGDVDLNVLHGDATVLRILDTQQ